MKSNKICGNAGAIHCNRKTLAGEKYFRRWEMKNTIMNTVSMPISHSHDGGVEWLCTELWVYLGVSAARGDKKDVVNNCHLFLRDSWIFIDRKMSIHLALGMFLVTFFFFFYTMSYSLWDLSSPSRDWTWAMAEKVLHLNHWPTSKLPLWLW